MNSGETIDLRAVRLTRGGRRVFDRLDLSLNERRIGIIGANGSGKSSLLRLINGLLLPDAGEVVVGARRTADAREQVMGQFGFVFQNPDHQILFPTVGEEISFGLTLRGMGRDAARARSEALLADHGCAGWQERACQELSEGQKQLVCILSAIAPQPHTLLLDECFASLDHRVRRELAEVISRLPQRQIMASHDLDLLGACERIVWLEEGGVRDDGPPVRVLAAYRAAMNAPGNSRAGLAS